MHQCEFDPSKGHQINLRDHEMSNRVGKKENKVLLHKFI